jgi:hypothetical protein
MIGSSVLFHVIINSENVNVVDTFRIPWTSGGASVCTVQRIAETSTSICAFKGLVLRAGAIEVPYAVHCGH